MVIPDFRNFQSSFELYHYGIKGKSGRYPLGSGDRPYQDYPGKRDLKKLNKLNTNKEAYQARKRINKGYQETYPKLTKVFKPLYRLDDKLNDASIKHYSKKFDEQIQKFKDAGINLDSKVIIKTKGMGDSTITFSGNKYYFKEYK